MPKPTIYIETSVIGYLTSRPSKNIVVAGHQLVTREWWTTARDRYELVASEFVKREVSAGDPEAARERLQILAQITLLEASDDALTLAKRLVASGAIPEKAAEDAAHVAVAASHGVQYLVTWNCRHIANATMRHRIDQACRDAGFAPIIICTPNELSGTNHDLR